MAGFLDQGAVEGVQAGWLLNFVIFGHLDSPPRGPPVPGGWIPGPGGRRGRPGRLVAQFRDFGGVVRAQSLPCASSGFEVLADVQDLMFRAAEQGKKPRPEQGRDAFRTSIMLSSLKRAGRWQIETRGPLRQRGRSVQDLVFRAVRTGQEASARAGSRLPPGVFRTSIDAFEPQEGWTMI